MRLIIDTAVPAFWGRKSKGIDVGPHLKILKQKPNTS